MSAAFQVNAFQNDAFQTVPLAQYRLISRHHLRGGAESQPNVFEAGLIITEGVDVPLGWVPTMDVDPLNTTAVNAYYKAGPRMIEATARQRWATIAVPPPVTFWTQIPGGRLWKLTGLGAGLPPIGLPAFQQNAFQNNAFMATPGVVGVVELIEDIGSP